MWLIDVFEELGIGVCLIVILVEFVWGKVVFFKGMFWIIFVVLVILFVGVRFFLNIVFEVVWVIVVVLRGMVIGIRFVFWIWKLLLML